LPADEAHGFASSPERGNDLHSGADRTSLWLAVVADPVGGDRRMLNNIQNLRALAAYSVVLVHCLDQFLVLENSLGGAYVGLLGGGVDLFFVISGFVMVHTTKVGEASFWFMIKRIARIVPLYWSATLLVVGIILVRRWGFPYADISPESVVASLFFIPYPQLDGGTNPILQVGWTLNYEMMFYVLFAVSMILPHRFRLVGIVSLITLVWGVAQFAGDSVAARFYARPIMFEFVAGCVIAYALRAPALASFVRTTPMWPVAIVAFAFYAATPQLNAYAPSFLTGLFSLALLVFAAAAQDLYRTPARETFITKLGDASYSAYLVHPIIMAIIHMILIVVWKDAIRLNMWSYLVVVAILTMICSLTLLRIFERPSAEFVRKLARRLIPPRPVAQGNSPA
jgi:exopolysaccharide production protein ExoZ